MTPFEQILDQFGPSILGFLRVKVGPERAEDCFQETMLAALRGYEDLNDPKVVKAWLFRIAGRKAIDTYRSDARRPVPDEAVGVVVDERNTARPGAGDVWSVVEGLPEKQALAVQLRYRGDLTHREVGEVMEISESAARRNVFEGLKRLRSAKDSWL